ncbi:MAG TPA: hypothetical protein VEH27_05760 [Methylomirabilota bacterium]|nr:hypothetical protein [Methylomirabilota bacterium]
MKLCSGNRRRFFHRSGVILLEVVLALALFVAAAAIFTASMDAAMTSLERQRLNLHAENLASSTLAEIQMGAIPLAAGALPPDPTLPGWTTEVVLGSVQELAAEMRSPLVQVEVVVRHTNNAVVKRLAQLVRQSEARSFQSMQGVAP